MTYGLELLNYILIICHTKILVLPTPNIHVRLFLALIYLFARVNNLRNQKYLDAFGENLKRLRRAKGLSQEKLALNSEMDYQQIYRIEHGKINTTISTILSISKALDVHPKELLDFEFED